MMPQSTELDFTVPHPARVWNYLSGGRDNFAADRRAASVLLARAPAFADAPRASRAFAGRVVRFLVAEAGVRQFIDIGPGLPTADSTHEVAQRSADSRVVYVDNDPLVLIHARALLRSAPGGAVGYIEGDLRDPGRILAQARHSLDFGQRVAILLLCTLHFIPGADEARSIIAALLAGVPAGSYLVIAHGASDLEPGLVAATANRNLRLRSREEVASLVDRLELVGPGLVNATEWLPDGEQADRGADAAAPVIPLYGLVARKPA